MFNNPDQKLTFFELFYRETDAGNKGVSLVQPFLYQATFILIISATMRYIALMCNIEFTSLITPAVFNLKNSNYRVWFITGYGVSSILSSLLFTYVFKR